MQGTLCYMVYCIGQLYRTIREHGRHCNEVQVNDGQPALVFVGRPAKDATMLNGERDDMHGSTTPSEMTALAPCQANWADG